MANLPFVVAPRFSEIIELIGSDESGKIEVPRKGYLTAGEKAFCEASMGEPEAAAIMFSLVRQAVSTFKVAQQEAHEIVSRLIQEEGKNKKEQDFKQSVSKDIDSMFMAYGEHEKRKRLVYALTILRYRVDPHIPVEEAFDLHPDLVNGLAELYEDEEKKSVARLQEAISKDTPEETEAIAKAAEKK